MSEKQIDIDAMRAFDEKRFAKFLQRIQFDESGCWLWTGIIDKPGGYGRFTFWGRLRLAHRVAYEHWIGKIPMGLQIDHLCRVRNCVNPDHLEAVTQRENLMRGIGITAVLARATHCKRGHPFDEANTTLDANGKRRCRECLRLQWKEINRRRREHTAQAKEHYAKEL